MGSSEVLQQLQRPRRSNVQQMSSVVRFSRHVLLSQAMERRQVSFGIRFLQSSLDGLEVCPQKPQVSPPRVFLGRCSLYRQRSAARFHWFLSRGLKTLRPGVHADDMIFGIRLRLEKK